MTVTEFCALYPGLSFNFDARMDSQPRVFDICLLEELPIELKPIHSYRGGGRGRPSRNQTKSHFQCSLCRRVLRNDFFVHDSSGNVFSKCNDCRRKSAAIRWKDKSREFIDLRNTIWEYIGGKCSYCGFNSHVAAIDMHHIADGKTDTVSNLVTRVAASSMSALGTNAYNLIIEVNKCIPLCSNCHRLAHVGVIDISDIKPTHYDVNDFIKFIEPLMTNSPALSVEMYMVQ